MDSETVNAARDDHVLPEARWASLVVFCILVPAVVVLWGMPEKTADLWAWTIMPELTPIFMGAGYGGGAYFFWRTYRARRWHPSSAGVFGAAFFAGLMLIATLAHSRRQPSPSSRRARLSTSGRGSSRHLPRGSSRASPRRWA